MFPKRYLLRVSLKYFEPEIWRNFVVPASISLDRLHDVLQIVMGWQDYHLHRFVIGKQAFTEVSALACEDNGEIGLDESDLRLNELVKRRSTTFSYEYDFGDGWQHEITLLDSNYTDIESSEEVLLCCTDGAMACPLEDVGGIGGYASFLEAINDPKHPDHDMYLEWVGGFPGDDFVYDSEDFDEYAVNLELDRYLRWSRGRVLEWLI